MENIFNLKNNYTKNELTSKFNQKINEINNLNISLIDKNLLIERYDKEYKRLLNNFFINNVFNTFRNAPNSTLKL
jgi:anion-transporting  ArsA/GET3 family ATPase